MLKIIPIGTTVTFGDGLTGVIIQIAIHPGDRTSYNVRYWINTEAKEDWLWDFEVLVSPMTKLKQIGFQSPNSSASK